MAISEEFYSFLSTVEEYQQEFFITMVRSWVINFLLCLSHTRHNGGKRQQQTSISSSTLEPEEKALALEPSPPICHTFSPPLKLCMLRKICCRIQGRRINSNIEQLLEQSKVQPIGSFLNESKNCAAQRICCNYSSRSNRRSSLIAIDIDNSESQEKKLDFYRQSPITQVHSDSPLAFVSHRKRSVHSYLSIQKQKSDSLVFVYQHDRLKSPNKPIVKQQSLINYHYHPSLYNMNSTSSNLSWTSPSSSMSTSPLISTKNEKTWRLKINDDLNKDGSRHFVMHKGSEESVRKRRQNKRDQRSEEKKRRVEEKISQANQRWEKYSMIDYELALFISRYYDRLPLCSNCRNYFTTHRTQFLAEQPRASMDYAADEVIRSLENGKMTLKQAAKARLIKDYDKQTDILFNLCDSCLAKCEQIRNELKQLSFSQKMSAGSTPNSNILSMTSPSELQQRDIPLESPNLFDIGHRTINTPVNTNLPPESYQNTLIYSDPDRFYLNNLIQYHHIKLQQFYQQSQHIIAAQQNCQSSMAISQQIEIDLQTCLAQMQFHCLEMLHLQYPGYSLSFPYMPSFHPQYLSYRHQENHDCSISSPYNVSLDESLSSDDEGRYSDSECESERCCTIEGDEKQRSMDDRLTVESCHGVVEYCNAPLDDFVRGLDVLKCLSTFNRYST